MLMAYLIGIMGESGSGKTTSLRNLDPSSTFIIDADGKGLAWRGWKKQYSVEQVNYKRVDSQSEIVQLLQDINANAPHIKVVVIDTLNGVMVAEEAAASGMKGFEKWSELAWGIWAIVTTALDMRDDLIVVMTAHSVTITDENGQSFTRILTNGRKLEKLSIESKMPCVLHAYRDEASGNYVFGVHARNSTAKTPLGLYDETETIPNDIATVIQDIKEYLEG